MIEWINKNDAMPNDHQEYEGCSKDVLVTDGDNWGFGRYHNDYNYWVYRLVGRIEQDDNKITHWAEPPKI